LSIASGAAQAEAARRIEEAEMSSVIRLYVNDPLGKR
jgi:hypothetical protein